MPAGRSLRTNRTGAGHPPLGRAAGGNRASARRREPHKAARQMLPARLVGPLLPRRATWEGSARGRTEGGFAQRVGSRGLPAEAGRRRFRQLGARAPPPSRVRQREAAAPVRRAGRRGSGVLEGRLLRVRSLRAPFHERPGPGGHQGSGSGPANAAARQKERGVGWAAGTRGSGRHRRQPTCEDTILADIRQTTQSPEANQRAAGRCQPGEKCAASHLAVCICSDSVLRCVAGAESGSGERAGSGDGRWCVASRS